MCPNVFIYAILRIRQKCPLRYAQCEQIGKLSYLEVFGDKKTKVSKQDSQNQLRLILPEGYDC